VSSFSWQTVSWCQHLVPPQSENRAANTQISCAAPQAVVEEPLVILVKLADRLHNMRTVYALPPAKQVAVAEETLAVWCSMAASLGWHSLKVGCGVHMHGHVSLLLGCQTEARPLQFGKTTMQNRPCALLCLMLDYAAAAFMQQSVPPDTPQHWLTCQLLLPPLSSG
jgi:hypothetical protein